MHNQTVVSFVIIIIIDKQVFLHSARFAFGLASQDGDESSLAEAAESQRFVAVGVSGRVELPSSVSLSLLFQGAHTLITVRLLSEPASAVRNLL